jgi:initiation factor 1A
MSKGKKVVTESKRALEYKTDDTEYGLVTKALGGGRFLVKINLQNREVIGKIRGKFKKGAMKSANIVEVGTIVLVGMRDFQEKMVDIVHVYKAEEARQLKKEGEILEECLRTTDDGESGQKVEEEFPFDFTEI